MQQRPEAGISSPPCITGTDMVFYTRVERARRHEFC
jgi:hypothetical protein